MHMYIFFLATCWKTNCPQTYASTLWRAFPTAHANINKAYVCIDLWKKLNKHMKDCIKNINKLKCYWKDKIKILNIFPGVTFQKCIIDSTAEFDKWKTCIQTSESEKSIVMICKMNAAHLKATVRNCQLLFFSEGMDTIEMLHLQNTA